MLCFTRNLGLIIGDLVPIGSELWSLYIILNKILDILLSKWIRTEEAVLLKTLVAEHHELFLKSFQINLRPKHHHMVHYPMIIQESGPLSLFWCMRFEAKHKELKDTANAITSRKNIQYILSLKHQLKLAYKFLSNTCDYYTVSQKSGPILTLSQDTLILYSSSTRFLDAHFNFINNDNIVFVSWVCIKNIEYNCKNMSLIINVSDENNCMLPSFGLIIAIFITHSNEPYVIFKNYTTLYFDEHFYAYYVLLNTTNELSCISLNGLQGNIFPTHSNKISDGSMYIKI